MVLYCRTSFLSTSGANDFGDFRGSNRCASSFRARRRFQCFQRSGPRGLRSRNVLRDILFGDVSERHNEGLAVRHVTQPCRVRTFALNSKTSDREPHLRGTHPAPTSKDIRGVKE